MHRFTHTPPSQIAARVAASEDHRTASEPSLVRRRGPVRSDPVTMVDVMRLREYELQEPSQRSPCIGLAACYGCRPPRPTFSHRVPARAVIAASSWSSRSA